jgi:peptidoglycan/xylan/chitin deacetylase (PgdA/CDA1 family)
MQSAIGSLFAGALRLRALRLSLILLTLVGSCPLAVSAESPRRNSLYVQVGHTVTNHAQCIIAGHDAGDAQFCLADLEMRTPKWRIPPPVWQVYPTLLDTVLLPRRTYSAETIAYLASHEVRSGDRSSGAVALTFDCEYHPHIARHILDTLRESDTHATFFLQGRFAYRNPDLVRRIVAEGHELGSHSFFHPWFTQIPPLRMTQELTYTEAAIAWAVGEYVPLRFLRFPYAGRNYATKEHVATLGYQSSFWDLDPRGWEPGVSAQDVVDYMARRAYSGGVVIMHCGNWDDAHALPDVIRVIRERGLTPTTLTEVLKPEDRDVPGYTLLPSP